MLALQTISTDCVSHVGKRLNVTTSHTQTMPSCHDALNSSILEENTAGVFSLVCFQFEIGDGEGREGEDLPIIPFSLNLKGLLSSTNEQLRNFI